MTDKPLFHDDLFACYPDLIERLKSLVENKTVKIIKEADDIGDLVGDNPNKLPLDEAIYVIFDSIVPTNSNANGTEQVHQIAFSLVYTVKKYNFRGLSGMSVGRVLARISQLLNGYEPVQDGKALTFSPFIQINPLPVRYQNGFGYFSLRFATTVASCADL
ncbi:hypothetical protein [Acinetobacter sp. c3-l95]|uniref:phage tail terminator protein n=1 Tax=Acinetobacter sp. c3-l95 TaxID=3342804 RepID=UPI0035B9E61F